MRAPGNVFGFKQLEFDLIQRGDVSGQLLLLLGIAGFGAFCVQIVQLLLQFVEFLIDIGRQLFYLHGKALVGKTGGAYLNRYPSLRKPAGAAQTRFVYKRRKLGIIDNLFCRHYACPNLRFWSYQYSWIEKPIPSSMFRFMARATGSPGLVWVFSSCWPACRYPSVCRWGQGLGACSTSLPGPAAILLK